MKLNSVKSSLTSLHNIKFMNSIIQREIKTTSFFEYFKPLLSVQTFICVLKMLHLKNILFK